MIPCDLDLPGLWHFYDPPPGPRISGGVSRNNKAKYIVLLSIIKGLLRYLVTKFVILGVKRGGPLARVGHSYVKYVTSDDFIITAVKSNIHIYTFPSYLIYILQPLDMGIFHPYKYYYREAVHKPISYIIAIQKLCSDLKPRPITPSTLLIHQLTPKPSTFKDSEQGLQR